MRIEENFARQQALFNARFNSADDSAQVTKDDTFSNALKKQLMEQMKNL